MKSISKLFNFQIENYKNLLIKKFYYINNNSNINLKNKFATSILIFFNVQNFSTKMNKCDVEWKKELPADVYRVLRLKGTEVKITEKLYEKFYCGTSI